MLIIAQKLSSLQFSKLMHVYRESNIENGSIHYPDLTAERQEAAAEQDFYQYLKEVFFRQKNSFYAIWELAGEYVAALRIEPYRDGFLLCALETAPNARNRGYATTLVKHVIQYLSEFGDSVIYSHVSKHNDSSLAVHNKCGFTIIDDCAVYSDGSVLSSSYTLKLVYKKTGSD